MSSSSPRVSVIVPAYRPGDAIDRVIDSLDAQTLPQSEFETIIVDDGSADGTFERLQRIAATRPNMRVLQIENSGWPSRPRNIATELARGEYVFFMDHDDSIYPDALRRGTEYGRQQQADVVSPKESKTSDIWWSTESLVDGNIPNALVDGGIDRLLPMVPHKFYRREFLLQHGIRFPEGRRALWEDIYQNVDAYRHARVVSVLADTPVYLWHSSANNNSKTYGPTDVEFWDRLDDLTAFIDRTLDGPAFAEARRSMLMHQYRTRVLARTARIVGDMTPEETALAGARASALQRRWIPADWDAMLGKQDRARAFFLREGRLDLLGALQAYDAQVSGVYEASDVQWRPNGLSLSVRAGLQWQDAPLRFRTVRSRVLRDLPRELSKRMPADLLDVTDEPRTFDLKVAVRDRSDKVTWLLAGVPAARFERLDRESVTIVAGVDTVVDPFVGAGGRPLDASVFDLYAMSEWMGSARGAGVRYDGAPNPAMLGDRGAVAYANNQDRLSLDLAQRLRSVVKDGKPAVDRAAGTASAFRLPLPAISVSQGGAIPTRVELSPASDALRRTFENHPMTGPIARLMTGSIEAQVIADENGDAHLVGGGEVRPGDYRMSFASEGEKAQISSLTMSVARDGTVQFAKKPIKPPKSEQ